MRTNVIVHSITGFLLGAAIVWRFSPIPGSFWGNTFFDIPYSVALWAVPIAASASAAFAAWWVLRRITWRSRSFVVRGIAIGVVAFALYASAHIFAWAVFSLSRGADLGLLLMGLLGWAFAVALFGGIFFMPVCCGAAVIGEWFAKRIAA